MKTQRLVGFVDVFPSLCELAGLEKPGQLQRKSFVPLLENPYLKWKEAVYSRYLRGKSVKTKDYLYSE
jgi:arylsulfatase A-like enzyme